MRKHSLQPAGAWTIIQLECDTLWLLSGRPETRVLVFSLQGRPQLWGPGQRAFPSGFQASSGLGIGVPQDSLPLPLHDEKHLTNLHQSCVWWCSSVKLHGSIRAEPGFVSCNPHPVVLKRSTPPKMQLSSWPLTPSSSSLVATL